MFRRRAAIFSRIAHFLSNCFKLFNVTNPILTVFSAVESWTKSHAQWKNGSMKMRLGKKSPHSFRLDFRSYLEFCQTLATLVAASVAGMSPVAAQLADVLEVVRVVQDPAIVDPAAVAPRPRVAPLTSAAALATPLLRRRPRSRPR